MAGYIPRWHTRPKTVTRPSTNRARRGLTLFMRRTPLTTTCTPRRQMSYCNPVSGRAACGGVFVCLPGSISPELNIQSLPVTLRMLPVAVTRSPPAALRLAYVTHTADLMDLCWCGRPDYCYRPSDSQVRSPSSLMNRFRAGQGPCRANLHRWGLAQSPSCDCGQRQTMNHIVDDTCPLTKFEGELNLLHEADDHAVYVWNPQRLRHSRYNNIDDIMFAHNGQEKATRKNVLSL